MVIDFVILIFWIKAGDNLNSVPKSERIWGFFSHFSAFAFFIFPFGHILGPVLVYILKKNDSPFIEDQAKESINFQITMSLYAVISGLLTIILIGFALLAVVFILDFVLVIIAALKANEGIIYRYPFTIRIIN